MPREAGNAPCHVLLDVSWQIVVEVSWVSTIAGRKSPQDHATAQRLVLLPCTNSVTAKLWFPCSSINFSTMVDTLLSFPSIVVYHLTCSRRWRLSSTIRDTKATSPPVETISVSVPVHVYLVRRACKRECDLRRMEDALSIQPRRAFHRARSRMGDCTW